ncbi:MAG: hypothetical protein ACRD30_09840 [Bryobacteraceae bacterium]
MAGEIQAASDYYAWEVPGASIAVHMHLGAMEGILADALSGFGILPKRGAEVGGLLLGAVEMGEPTVVRVERFEPVDCEYGRGPSYLLTGTDREALETAVANWQPDPLKKLSVVGFYRSHTRDGMSLTAEDRELLDEFFPSPEQVALLIKPYVSKPSAAGFFFREDGKFQDSTPLSFVFRRRPMKALAPDAPIPELPAWAAPYPEPEPEPKIRRFAWIPLSFLFLLFGIALGLTISFARGTGPSRTGELEFSLGLTVSKSDQNLNVKWDRLAPAIRAAQRGSLEIEDSGFTKIVDLDPATLQTGAVTVQNHSHIVRFRLTVYPGARISLTETMEWKQ